MELTYKGGWRKLLALTTIALIASISLALPQPTKAQGVTLTVLTRHASDIQDIFETEFLKTNIARNYGITGITFKLTASPFWADMIEAGGIDVVWGGGPTLFDTLAEQNLLRDMNASPIIMEEANVINDTFAGAPLKRWRDGKLVWVAAAISSFGFTVNEDTRGLFDLPIPKKWDDLTKPQYFREPQVVGIVNAPESTSNTRMYEIMLQGFEWDKGWEIITLMGGNSRVYHGSTESLGAVVEGTVAVALTIDFYGFGAQLQNPRCKYVIPEGQSIVNGDPIALAVNATHPAAAEAFVKYVLSKEGQAQWLRTELNRLPIRFDAFDTDLGRQRPELQQIYIDTAKQTGIEFDDTLSLSWVSSVIYYFEAVITNAHAELVDAWKKVIEVYNTDPAAFEMLSQELGRPLITKEEAIRINQQMETDAKFREEKKSAWYSQAINNYANVAGKAEKYIKYGLSVYVFDKATNQPVSGTTVGVYFANNTLARETTANATGYATFSLSRGSYFVRARLTGYTDYKSETFTLSQDVKVNVPMAKEAPALPLLEITAVVAIVVIAVVVVLLKRRT